MNHLQALENAPLQLGYIPLLDCVALLWAKHQGYFSEVGLNVTLVKEASWASLRDRLAFGFLDAAHCLSAMLPAAHLGIDQVGIALQTPLVLSVNCAFISLNQQLCYQLNITEQDAPQVSAHKIFQAFHSEHTLRLAHVFPHSIHHYCLREWLALAHADFAANLKLNTCPPPHMVETLSKHLIDGFCVGEPWNTQAQIKGVSQIIASSQDIIPAVADKVLAVTDEWAKMHPHHITALKTAIIKAQDHLRELEDFTEVWQLLKDYQIIQFECSAHIHVNEYYKIQSIIKSFAPKDTTPHPSDFQWILTQMVKWNQIKITDQVQQHIAAHCIL